MDSYTNYEYGRPVKRARSSPDAPSVIGGALADLGQMSTEPGAVTTVPPVAARSTASKQENVSTAVYRKEARSSKTLSCNECRRCVLAVLSTPSSSSDFSQTEIEGTPSASTYLHPCLTLWCLVRPSVSLSSE